MVFENNIFSHPLKSYESGVVRLVWFVVMVAFNITYISDNGCQLCKCFSTYLPAVKQ